jgi:uroporphyrinogen III methyltransferase/synthase
VTRARGRNEPLAAELRAAGLEVIECPLVRTEPIPGPRIRADRYDWIVLTSREGADAFFRRVDGATPPVAVVGPGTAETVRAHGVEPALVASVSTQDGLVAELPRPAGRVLFAGAEGARDVLVRELGAEFVPLYRTVPEPRGDFPDVDLVVLASGSAARALGDLRRDLPCVSIGPATTEEARAAGLIVVGEASAHDLDGLVGAVKLAASAIESSRS